MDFKPKQSENNPLDVPYYSEADADNGWAGHTTGKSIRTLRSEIVQAMTRIGATVIDIVEGTFGSETSRPREGFLIKYSIDGIIGQIKIAALPVKKPPIINQKTRQGYETRKQKSIKMALYMFERYVSGMWYAQQLSPGYLPLIPWLIEEGSGKTFSELFTERNQFALPAPDGESIDINFVEGEFEEKNE